MRLWRRMMKAVSLQEELARTSYPGRGIMIGRSGDGTKAVIVYFIMGRSVNSRNRVFVTEGEGIRTEAFDPSKMEDPSLIIYSPVRVRVTESAGEQTEETVHRRPASDTIVTNGDQTDTVYEGMEKGETFEQSLRCRKFEPDEPNFTPRISGLVHVGNGKFTYEMSILKSDEGSEDGCNRYHFSYDNPREGEGRFLHTYLSDGNPLPSFEGEPTRVTFDMGSGIDALTDSIWNALDPENKVSLFVRIIDISTGLYKSKIINKNQ